MLFIRLNSESSCFQKTSALPWGWPVPYPQPLKHDPSRLDGSLSSQQSWAFLCQAIITCQSWWDKGVSPLQCVAASATVPLSAVPYPHTMGQGVTLAEPGYRPLPTPLSGLHRPEMPRGGQAQTGMPKVHLLVSFSVP